MNFFNKIKYILQETKRNFRLFSINTLASFTTIFLTILFVSLMTFFFLSSKNVIEKSLQENQLRIFLTENGEEIFYYNKLVLDLKLILGIDSIHFISKEEALEEYRQDFGQEMLENITYNPLPSSFILFLGRIYQQKEKIEKLQKTLKSLKYIEEVSQSSEYVQWIEEWRWPILLIFIIISFLFGLFLILLISNTIKINLYKRKTIIQNMLYCGAGYNQIFFPQLLENTILCFIGGLFSSASIFSVLYFANKYLFFLDIEVSYLIYIIFFLLPFVLVLPTSHFTIHKIIKNVSQS